MDRAYATLELRSVDDDLRIVEGIANSASEDSHGTVIEPSGAVYTLPLPFHWHHNNREPVGQVIASELREGKRWVQIQIAKIADDGTEGGREVKRRVDGAWADLKAGLVRGLSVEFLPLEPKSQRATRWTKWRWLGLAGVTIPSNQDATILAVRSAFEGSPGLSGNDRSPGVSGTTNQPTTRRGTMTVQEQIVQHENSRAAKVARQTALMEAAAGAGETLGETEAEEYDTLTREVEAIDGHLSRLNSLKRANAATATPVAGNGTAAASLSRGAGEGGTETRGGVPIVRVQSREEPGTGYARYVMSLVRARGDHSNAANYAEQAFGDQGKDIAIMHRAAVAAGNTTTSGWASQLVQTNYLNEFLELLRPKTLIGRIPGIRKVPFNTSMPAQSGGGTYGWVGEGAPKPVTRPTYTSVSLTKAKIAGITVLTKELVRLSTPDAQVAVRDEMVAGIQQFMDGQLIDSTVAAGASNPASITNGVTGTAASGTAATDAYSDIGARIAAFAAANYSLAGLVILMGEATAFILGLARDAAGNKAFPDLRIDGGNIQGVPVVTSETVGAQIILVHAPSILMADEGGMEIDASEEASVQMDSEPTNPADATTVLTSLWQHNLVGIRVERMITWGKARSTAVDRITSVAYVA